LDEPTAHLDPENQRALTADLLAATTGRPNAEPTPSSSGRAAFSSASGRHKEA
jgi:hypothetical protein